MNSISLPPRRPQVDQTIIASAATALATAYTWNESQAEDIKSVYRPHMDGYELAKALESKCGWIIDAGDVNDLDDMDAQVQRLHLEACRQWAITYNIQPTLPIGTMITRGEITGISDHSPATYLVRDPKNDTDGRRYLIRFEDAVPIAAQVASAAVPG